MNNVYFKSISINKAFNTATLVVTSAPMETKQATIAGIDVGTRVQHQITFGLLSIIDPETGKTIAGNSKIAKQLQTTLNAGDALEGFQMSSNPVMDRETGEPTDMYWVEAI
jgi:hypothetical protein|tara:strand:+ start:50 stop:382 length:333 start_codon:yes stop_codon:yes gene_type:complete